MLDARILSCRHSVVSAVLTAQGLVAVPLCEVAEEVLVAAVVCQALCRLWCLDKGRCRLMAEAPVGGRVVK